MNINDQDANVVSSAIDYFLKQDIPTVSAERKSQFDYLALEAKSIITSHDKEMNVSHIQAVAMALEMYAEYLKKSLLSNPKTLSTAESLVDRFYAFLEPLLDSQ